MIRDAKPRLSEAVVDPDEEPKASWTPRKRTTKNAVVQLLDILL
jgi:hypothetical protein